MRFKNKKKEERKESTLPVDKIADINYLLKTITSKLLLYLFTKFQFGFLFSHLFFLWRQRDLLCICKQAHFRPWELGLQICTTMPTSPFSGSVSGACKCPETGLRRRGRWVGVGRLITWTQKQFHGGGNQWATTGLSLYWPWMWFFEIFN